MGHKIYLDTNLYIAFFEDRSGISKRVENFLVDPNVEIVASPLVHMELLIAPLREKHEQLTNIYQNLEKFITNFRYADFSLKTSQTAAMLRAKYGLATPDCIHLATAIEEKADIFYTADKGIIKVKEIKIEIIKA